MDSSTTQPTEVLELTRTSRTLYAAMLLLVIIAGLVTYKATAALAVMQKVQNTGAFAPRTNVLPLPGSSLQLNVITRSLNYFLVIWPALLFGILISGAFRVMVQPRWLSRILGTGYVRPQLVAGAAGVPLMLCSCCAAPIFSSMYERSCRLGPSLAITLAAPSLNPAALILTFMLFDTRIASVRLMMAGAAVFVTATLVDILFSQSTTDCGTDVQVSRQPMLIAFLRSTLQVAVRTVPLIIVGVLLSMLIALWLPTGLLTSSWGKMAAIVVVAFIAVPLAMPTFFEIPLALIMISAGAPAGCAVAMLIAGPAINLSSLLTITRATNWRVAVTIAVSILVVAIAAAALVSFL